MDGIVFQGCLTCSGFVEQIVVHRAKILFILSHTTDKPRISSMSNYNTLYMHQALLMETLLFRSPSDVTLGFFSLRWREMVGSLMMPCKRRKHSSIASAAYFCVFISEICVFPHNQETDCCVFYLKRSSSNCWSRNPSLPTSIISKLGRYFSWWLKVLSGSSFKTPLFFHCLCKVRRGKLLPQTLYLNLRLRSIK